MKKISTLIVLIVCCSAGFSQMPTGAPGGRAGGFGGQAPSIGHFYGKIVDAKTGKGLDGVSVQLVQVGKMDTTTKVRKDTPIAGMITSNKGDFSLENLPLFGNFHLKITAIGYKPYDQKVAFDMKLGKGQGQGGGDMQQALAGVDKDLGNIKLDADAQTLEQVTVTASKPLVQLESIVKYIMLKKTFQQPVELQWTL